MCEIHGGSLAHIVTSEEQLFVDGLIANFKLAHNFWLGGSDWGKESEWVWEPEGVSLNYTNWYRGRPDNGGHNEHCLLLERHYHGSWDDRDCHAAYHYICETA
ncbi:hypothetical protein FSP39_021683 [Pinctada imbricata]|uniref:C-type lectin domain-containing protein n=1 Tax=Pinctada imbricata TaxID=66713 RepID=A0AA89BSG4_PINIB|nr:hypothetical protein FSP39_021683 [Pinctada imbricata]